MTVNPSLDSKAPILLEARSLAVNFTVHGGQVKAVRDVSFRVHVG